MKLNRVLMAMLATGFIHTGINAAEVKGVLKDKQNNVINNALIKVRDRNVETRTDASGNFTLDLPAGSYTLDVEAGKKGHFHQTIEVDDAGATLEINMPLHMDEVLVIAANPLEHTRLDMATPTIVLSGDELAMKRGSTLGDILTEQPGVSMSSFGPAVARPVIRGLSGGRVLMTGNQMTVQDASVTSADHDVSIEPLLAEQIEVLKGPATLLYGSGAIGGVVNVTDSRINPNGGDGVSGGLELRLGDGATGEQSAVVVLNGGTENFAWHFDAFDTETDDIEIPSYVESDIYHEAEEEEEHEGEEHEEEERIKGVLENSRSKSDGIAAGATWNGDWGYFGVSINSLDKLYGVPGEGHAHEEEGAMGAEEEEEETISIDMEQTRIDAQGSFNNPFDGIDEWFIGLSNTDYEHTELEGDETGTIFKNDATELKSFLRQETDSGWRSVYGIQFTNRDFEAIGDEAFVPASETETRAIFALTEKRFGDLKLELGARVETQDISVDGFSSTDETATSLSAGYVMDVFDGDKFAVNLSHSERIATVEELYSFGEHLATSTFEIGDPTLSTESVLGLDISYRIQGEDFRGEINGYWNQYSDFIYGSVRENTGMVMDLNGNMVAIDDDFPVIAFTQQDADIRGIEVALDYALVTDASYDLWLGFKADTIEAELDNGNELPRIPPWTTGINLHLDVDALSAELSYTRYAEQDKVSSGELPTEGFDMLDLELGYRIYTAQGDWLLFMKAKNLLDEDARDHASFLKDQAPRAGRSLVMGVRYQF